jgi:hypothetical protein
MMCVAVFCWCVVQCLKQRSLLRRIGTETWIQCAVLGVHLYARAVLGVHLYARAVLGVHLYARAVLGVHLYARAVLGGHLYARAVLGVHLYARAVLGVHLGVPFLATQIGSHAEQASDPSAAGLDASQGH